MDARTLADHIIKTLDGVDALEVNGDWFMFYDARDGTPVDQRMPFVTIVTSDAHDQASDLTSRGAYRLNIGVSRETYEARFGPPPPGPLQAEPIDTGHDYTQLDILMPHPVYSPLNWVCVVSPSNTTVEAITPLLQEAHRIAAERHIRRDARQ